MKKHRDYGKYRFNGKTYSKGQLVLAVILHYMQENPKTTASTLRVKFSRDLQNRFEVVAPVKEAEKLSTRIKRYFLRKEQIIRTKTARLAVTNYWGSTNIRPFLDYVRKEFGYRITKVSLS